MAKGWSIPPSAFIKVVEAELVERRKEITATALQVVISESPEDTGAFRGNHRVTIDGVDLGYDLELRDLGGAQALADGNAVIGAIDTPYGESVIQNNMPYATALENGHSEQAAQGVYGPAFVLVREKFSR